MSASTHEQAKAACVEAMRLLGVAAREHDATAPAVAFQYRFTAAMLGRHLEAMHDPVTADRPVGADAASFVSTGGRA